MSPTSTRTIPFGRSASISASALARSASRSAVRCSVCPNTRRRASSSASAVPGRSPKVGGRSVSVAICSPSRAACSLSLRPRAPRPLPLAQALAAGLVAGLLTLLVERVVGRLFLRRERLGRARLVGHQRAPGSLGRTLGRWRWRGLIERVVGRLLVGSERRVGGGGGPLWCLGARNGCLCYRTRPHCP